MSLIHLARNNTVLGQFTEAYVRAGLDQGTFNPSDLAWKTGMPQWTPLGTWPEFSANEAPPFPHAAEPAPAASVSAPAWERRSEIGFFTALIETTKQVLVAPGVTFSHINRDGGYGAPLTYYLIPQVTSWLIVAASFGAWMSLKTSASTGSSHGDAAELTTALEKLGGPATCLTLLVTGVIGTVLSLFLISAVVHLMLKLWGASGAAFSATFRTLAYALGAAGFVCLPLQFLSIIPCVGMLIAMIMPAVWIWTLIITIKGLSTTHRRPIGLTAGAVLTPILLCCCSGALLYVVGIAAFIAQSQH